MANWAKQNPDQVLTTYETVTPRISQIPATDGGRYCAQDATPDARYRTWVFSFWYTRTTSRIDMTIKDRSNVTAKLGRCRRHVANKVEIEAHRRKHGTSGRHHQLYHRSLMTRRHRVCSALLKKKFWPLEKGSLQFQSIL